MTSRVCVIVCRAHAGVRPVSSIKGASALSSDEVDFLQAVANSRVRPTKRRLTAEVVPLRPPSVAPLPDIAAEELLCLPPTSDLDIAGCGPRAAGRLLKDRLISERARSVCTLRGPRWICMCACLCVGQG